MKTFSGRQMGTPVTAHSLARVVMRAAYDVGTSQSLSLTVADVDTSTGRLQKVHYHGSVPCPVEMFGGAITPAGEQTLANAFTQLQGRMSHLLRMPSEAAGVLSPQLSQAQNSGEVFTKLGREFLVNLVKGTPKLYERYSLEAYTAAAELPRHTASRVLIWTESPKDGNIVLVRRSLGQSDDSDSTASTKQSLVDLEAGIQNRVWNSEASARAVEKALLEGYQMRSPGEFVSVNPVTVSEAHALVNDLTDRLEASLPKYLQKGVRGDVLLGSSRNGGALNIAARCVGTVRVSEPALTHTLFGKMVGLTDSYFARSMPEPTLVIPKLCLTLSMLRALQARAITYLPEVCVTHGVLVDKELYLESRRDEIDDDIKRELSEDYKVQQFTRPWRAVGGPRPHFDPRIPNAKSQPNFIPRSLGNIEES